MYEYRTAYFQVTGVKQGRPLEIVDEALANMVADGWECIQLSHTSHPLYGTVVLLMRREKR